MYLTWLVSTIPRKRQIREQLTGDEHMNLPPYAPLGQPGCDMSGKLSHSLANCQRSLKKSQDPAPVI